MSLEKSVLTQLSQIIDPDLGKDIVSLGFIKDLVVRAGRVSFAIELTTPACPIKDEFKSKAESLVKALPDVKSVHVEMTSGKKMPNPIADKKALAGIKSIIAVSSCKGGVGKSTVSVNLAFALSKAGAKVGIFDADIYGPSLPTMVELPSFKLDFTEDELIIPPAYEEVKLMSFGYTNTDGMPAILRGPMASQITSQLLTTTDWGELDYLIIDTPPGTGDIQLTLLQALPITAAVIVTTPQKISFIDVVKGIRMFDKLQVPTVAVVENMSYYKDDTGKIHHIFGHGAKNALVKEFGIKNAFEIPISPIVSAAGDFGHPLALNPVDSTYPDIFDNIAASVVREVSKVQFGNNAKPKLTFIEGTGVKIQFPDGHVDVITAKNLRIKCGCAICVDEFTNVKKLVDKDVAEDIKPLHISPVGNYAVGINWSDGHSSLYPYENLV